MAVLSGAPAYALLPTRARRIKIVDPLDGVLADIARASLSRHLSAWAQRPDKKVQPGDRIGGSEGTRFLVRRVIDDRLAIARDELLDREVLIRFVDTDTATTAARATAGLRHDGISRLLDVEQMEDHAFFIMEAIDGFALSDDMGRMMSAARAVAIAREIADMIAHAHEQGAVHGRLDASQVVITADRRVCLVGFGAASSDRGAVADVQSIGEILFQLLSGEAAPAAVAAPHHLRLRRPDLDEDTIRLVCSAIDGDIDAAALRDALEDTLISLRREETTSTAWLGDDARLSS